MPAEEFQLDRRHIRRSFSGASRYENHDALHRAVHADLLTQLDYYLGTPERVIDVGAGDGRGTADLKRRYPQAEVLALDLAPGMLQRARRHSRWRQRFARVAGDGAQLPLPHKSVDLIYSNLCMHWVDEPMRLFREWVRVLRPGGYLAASTFGPDTLIELREAWAEADAGPHVGRFLDMHDLGDAVFAAGFKEPVLDVSRYTLTYAEPLDLLRELKGLGATNANAARARGLTGRRRWQRMLDALAARRNAEGRIPATFEVVTLHAWGPVWRWREKSA